MALDVWQDLRLRWAAGAVAVLVLAVIVTYLSLAPGRQTPSGAHPAHAATASTVSGLSDAAHGAAAQAAPPAEAPANVPAAAPAAAPASAESFTCPEGSACNWSGSDGTGHEYIDTNKTISCGSPITVRSVLNNTSSYVAYTFDNGHCTGTPQVAVLPGASNPGLNPPGKGYALIDPEGEGNLASCENAVCLWYLVGYSGDKEPFASPVDCFATTDLGGGQRFSSVADTSEDLVAYLYTSAGCTGQPAVVAPGGAYGNLTGAGTFASIRVVRLQPGSGTVEPPLTTTLVVGPGGASVFALFSDLASCQDTAAPVTAACFLFADGTVVGQINPLETAYSVLDSLIPGTTQHLASLDNGACSIVPRMGSSAEIVEAVNQSGSPMLLGPGTCAELGASAGEGTTYSIAAGLSGIVGPSVAAVAYQVATPVPSSANLVNLKSPKLLGGPSAINGLGFTHLADTSEVFSTIAGTPAEGAGLLKGDQITAVNGQPVANFEEYLAYIRQLGSDAPWTLTLFDPDAQKIVSVNVHPANKPVLGGGSVPAT